MSRPMKDLVNKLYIHEKADIFQQPVDAKKLNLPLYHQIIKRPMDLGTIKDNLERKQYSSDKDVARDIRQVWINCMIYNREGSPFYFIADQLSKLFEEKYEKLCRKSGVIYNGEEKVPSVEMKMTLSSDLLALDQGSLGKMLMVVDALSPDAISKDAIDPTSDSIDLDIESLTPKSFYAMQKAIEILKHSKSTTQLKRSRTFEPGGVATDVMEKELDGRATKSFKSDHDSSLKLPLHSNTSAST